MESEKKEKKKIEMLQLQPPAKGGRISSGLDVDGRVAEVEQTRTLRSWGCSARSKTTFSLRNPSVPHLERQIHAAL